MLCPAEAVQVASKATGEVSAALLAGAATAQPGAVWVTVKVMGVL